MNGLIGIISMITFFVCLIGLIFSLIQRKRKKIKRKFTLGLGVSFIAFVMAIAMSSPTNKSPENTKTVASSISENKINNNNNKENKPIKIATIETSKTTTTLGKLKIHYIDVGQADSILVEQDKHFMLIDAGNNEDDKLVVDYLKKQGVSKLDYLIGTHPHEDHIGGLDKVIDNFNIGTLLMPKKIANTKTFKDVLTSAQKKNLKITQPTVGTSYNFGKAVFTILAPKNHDYESVNNYSIVQKLKFGNTSFIFTGDAEAINEMEMVNANLDLQADVLKTGHHGSKTSTCQTFLDKINPKYAVISCGKDNKYKHPNKATMDRLKTKNIKVYRTDESGTIVATSDGKNIAFNCNPGSYNYRDNATNTLKKASKPTANFKTNINYPNNSNFKTPQPTKRKSQPKNTVKKQKKSSRRVWLSATGSKYHSIPNCGRMNPSKARQVPIEEAQGSYSPCSKCM